jgi:hypothetical protein
MQTLLSAPRIDKLNQIAELLFGQPRRPESDRERLAVKSKLELHGMTARAHEQAFPNFRRVASTIRLCPRYIGENRP